MAASIAAGYSDLHAKGYIMDVFADAVQTLLYAETCLPKITESGYLGKIKDKGQTITIARQPEIESGKYDRGMVTPINTKVSDPLTLKVDRARYWNQFWDRLDLHQTHIRMLQPETARAAASRLAEDIEREFFAEFATFADASNVGATAGKQSGAYNLGTAENPVGVKADTIIPYLTQFVSVLGEQNVGPAEGPKAVVIPEMFRWYLINSAQLSDASKIGSASTYKTNKVTNVGGLDIYTSTLLEPFVVNGHVTFPIMACAKKAINYVVALNEVEVVKPYNMHGSLSKGLVLYDWGNVRSEGVSVGYAYGNDTSLITGS